MDPTHSPPTQVITLQPPSMFGRFGKWMLLALVVAVLFSISMYSRYQTYFTPTDRPQEKYHSLSRTATQKIAIIEVSGAIIEGDNSFAKRQIDRVREDENVVGVVVRINSPGGTVTGSDYIYHHLQKLADQRDLPLVVSMGSVAASGGYYVAMAVGSEPDTIYAEPSTWTGSIGVVIPHFDLSGLLDKAGIEENAIASGPLKQMGTPTRPMTEEERALLQGLVDETFADFKRVVASGRPKLADDPETLDAVATGQIFTASQAIELGLVDELGFVEAAIERVAQLASVSTEEVRCVRYKERPTVLTAMMGSQAGVPQRPSVDLAALLDLAAPRAYYLWTWLPAIATSSR